MRVRVIVCVARVYSDAGWRRSRIGGSAASSPHAQQSQRGREAAGTAELDASFSKSRPNRPSLVSGCPEAARTSDRDDPAQRLEIASRALPQEGERKPTQDSCLRDGADAGDEGGGGGGGKAPPSPCVGGAPVGAGGSRAADYALQKVQITSFIRHILEQYRFGMQILAEFIQNADDARASEIDIGIDERVHSAARGGDRGRASEGDTAALAHNMAELLGPAFTVYNNETFSEQDFVNITNTGDSGKRQDASKTGRFCLGINTAFHLGDCVLLVTGHRLVAFDPTRKFFPEPLLIEFGHADGPGGADAFADRHPDFCRPFEAYGISFREEYKGTLFRIPLRTATDSSALTKRVYSVQTLWEELLEGFADNASQCLLFLKHLESITVHSLTAAGRREVCRAQVAQTSKAFLADRSPLRRRLLAPPAGGGKLSVGDYHARLAALKEELRSTPAVGEHTVEVELETTRRSRLSRRAGTGVASSRARWLVCSRVAGGDAVDLALGDPDALEERKVPLVQV